MKKKLYKSGKHWTIGYGKYFAAAAVATAGLNFSESIQNEAYASTVLTSEKDKAIEVSVPVEEIDNATKNADNHGIEVVKDENKNQVITSDKSEQTINEIENNYENQANFIDDSVDKIINSEEKLNQAQENLNTTKIEDIKTDSADDYVNKVNSVLDKLKDQENYAVEYEKIGSDVYWVNGQTDVFDSNGNKVFIDKNSEAGIAFASGFNAGGENSSDWDGGSDFMRPVKNGDTFIIRGAKSSSGEDVGDIKITFNNLQGWGNANDFAVNFFNFKSDQNGRSAVGISLTSRNGLINTGMKSYSWNIEGSNDVKTVVVNDIDALQTVTTPGKIIQVGNKVTQTSENTAVGRSDSSDDAGGTGFAETGVKVENGQGEYKIVSSSTGAVSITISLFGYETGLEKRTPIKYNIEKPVLHYQLTNLFVQQLNEKESQVDGDGIDDNGKTVSKNQIINFPLLNDSLSEDRSKNIDSYVVVDEMSEYLKTTQEIIDSKLKENKLDDLWVAKVTGGTNEGGQTIKYTATDKLLALMNAEKNKKFDIPNIPMAGFITKDGAEGKNKFKTIINNDYIVESNEVINKTPDPKPEKDVSNLAGINIDGKTVMPGTNNIYVLNWDLSVYKDVVASDDQIKKGFFFIDDYPEEVFSNVENGVNQATLIDEKGNKISGVTGYVYKNVSDAPAEIAEMINSSIKNGYIQKINGAFIVWAADDPKRFFNDYIKTGMDIKIKLPLKVSDSANDVNFKNTAFQFDFGQGYQTKTVSNNVPDIESVKNVVASDGITSIDNQNIKVGDYGYYQLDSPDVPKTENGLGEPIHELSGFDVLSPEYDRYTGIYKVISTSDIELSDKNDTNVDYWNELNGLTNQGSNLIPKGTDLSKFVQVTYGNYKLPNSANEYVFTHDVFDIENNKYSAGTKIKSGVILKDVFYWSFDKEFLNSLKPESGIDYQMDLQFQRVKDTGGLSGESLSNQAIFSINNTNYYTNLVKTKTTQDIPEQKNENNLNNIPSANLLPNTGYSNNNEVWIGLGTLLTATFAAYSKRKFK